MKAVDRRLGRLEAMSELMDESVDRPPGHDAADRHLDRLVGRPGARRGRSEDHADVDRVLDHLVHAAKHERLGNAS